MRYGKRHSRTHKEVVGSPERLQELEAYVQFLVEEGHCQALPPLELDGSCSIIQGNFTSPQIRKRKKERKKERKSNESTLENSRYIYEEGLKMTVVNNLVLGEKDNYYLKFS